MGPMASTEHAGRAQIEQRQDKAIIFDLINREIEKDNEPSS